MRICLASAFVMLTAAGAAAQPVQPAVSLNLSAGSVGSTSRVMLGAVAQFVVGTDVRISRNWELRFEVGRRTPSFRSWEPQSQYYAPSPDDPSRPVQVDTTQLASEDTLADVAILARRVWAVRERFETALLAGVDIRVVRHRLYLSVPQSLTDPSVVHVYDSTMVRRHPVLDIGIEGGARVGDRWRVLVYGIAGLQTQIDNTPRPQLRSGMTLKRVF